MGHAKLAGFRSLPDRSVSHRPISLGGKTLVTQPNRLARNANEDPELGNPGRQK